MKSPTGTLFNIQRFSTEDGPGIRSTLFFKGCPLACPWCHNPEGLNRHAEILWQSATCLGCGDCAEACPEKAIEVTDSRVCMDRARCKSCGRCADACPSGARELVGVEYGVDELLEEVLKDRTFFSTSGGGITFSGGEPLMQHRFLLEFAPRCRAEGLHIALDTCGLVREEHLERVLEFVDLVLFDLKLIEPHEHKRLTGGSLDVVLAGLERVVAAGLPIWIRTPIIPGHTDSEENLRGIAKYVKAHVPTIERYELLAFSNLCPGKYEMLDRTFSLAGEPLLTDRTMEHLTQAVRSEGIDVVRWTGSTRQETKMHAKMGSR